MKTSQEGEILI